MTTLAVPYPAQSKSDVIVGESLAVTPKQVPARLRMQPLRNFGSELVEPSSVRLLNGLSNEGIEGPFA